MTDNQPKFDGQLAIASILAIIFIFLTAWLVYISQVKIPQEQANAERLSTLEARLSHKIYNLLNLPFFSTHG